MENVKEFNVRELREELIRSFIDSKNGKIGVSQLKADSVAVAVIVKTANSEMEYNKQHYSKKKIEFFES